MAQVLSESKYAARRLPGPVNHRYAEMDWLRDHEAEYRGLWVALDPGLIACGATLKEVMEESKRLGHLKPLVHQIPKEPELPFGGW